MVCIYSECVYVRRLNGEWTYVLAAGMHSSAGLVMRGLNVLTVSRSSIAVDITTFGVALKEDESRREWNYSKSSMAATAARQKTALSHRRRACWNRVRRLRSRRDVVVLAVNLLVMKDAGA